jgi:hypothetical protein
LIWSSLIWSSLIKPPLIQHTRSVPSTRGGGPAGRPRTGFRLSSWGEGTPLKVVADAGVALVRFDHISDISSRTRSSRWYGGLPSLVRLYT